MGNEATTNLPASVEQLLADFRAASPDLSIWERWPGVTEEEGDFTDDWECTHVSKAFARFARARGFTADLVDAQDDSGGFFMSAGYHMWTRLRAAGLQGEDIDVDWTARQFYNLECPPREEHANLPCPLVWPADGHHPVVTEYRPTVHHSRKTVRR